MLLKLDEKLGAPRKQIPKSSQEQQPKAAFVFHPGCLGIQECPRGSSNPPWTVFSLEQRFSCPCLGGQLCPGAQALPPSRLSAHLHCTNIPAALITIAWRRAIWGGREGGVHRVWSFFRCVSHVGNSKTGN